MNKLEKAIFYCGVAVWFLCAACTAGYSLGYMYGEVVQKINRM